MNGPAQVPLIESLRSVPAEAFAIVAERGPLLGSRSIPYGRYCHEAAAALASLEATEPAFKAALLAKDDRIQNLNTELLLAHKQIEEDTARFTPQFRGAGAFFFYQAGALMCDRELHGLTGNRMDDDGKRYYGSRWMIGESMSIETAKALAAALGGRWTAGPTPV